MDCSPDFYAQRFSFRFRLLLPRDALCALRGITTAIVSVRLSHCLSVTLMYRGYISWGSSKVITRIIRLGYSLLGEPTSAIQCKGNTPKIRVELGWCAVLRKTPAISLKRDKIGPKSTTLDYLERPLRTLFQNTFVSEPTTNI